MNTNETTNACGCAVEKKHCAPVVNQFFCKCCDGCEGDYEGSNGHSPYIGENGNWFEWSAEANDFVDTGVRAEGPQGDKGDKGDQGLQGIQGPKGDTGVGSTINVVYDATGEDGPDLGKPQGIALEESVKLAENIWDYKWFRAGYFISTNNGLTKYESVVMSNWVQPLGDAFCDGFLLGDPITGSEATVLYLAGLQAYISKNTYLLQLAQRTGITLNRSTKTISDVQSAIAHTKLYRFEVSNHPW